MMGDIDQQALSPVPVTIGGREFLLSSLRFRDHAEAARRMRKDWSEPTEVLKSLRKGLDESQTQQLLEIAYREERQRVGVDLKALWAWYRSPMGIVVRYWLMLRRLHPELTLDEVDELLLHASSAELKELAQAGRESHDSNASIAACSWEKIFLTLRDRYGWTPNEISEMTISQIFMHWIEGQAENCRSPFISREEAVTRAQNRKDQREKWIETMNRSLENDHRL